MLVISRRTGECLQIGNNVLIKVIRQKNGQVQLGIEAPKEVLVYREEIIKRMEAEQRYSTRNSTQAGNGPCHRAV